MEESDDNTQLLAEGEEDKDRDYGDSSDDVDIDQKHAAPMEEGLHMFATLLKMFIGSGVLFLPKSFRTTIAFIFGFVAALLLN